MSQERLEFIISARVDLQKALAEIMKISDVMDEVSQGTKTFGDAMEELQPAVANVADSLERAANPMSRLSKDMQEMQKRTQEAAKEFAKLNEAATLDGGDGTGVDVLGAFSTEQLEEVKAYTNFMNSSLPAAIAKADAQTNKLTESTRRYRAALSKESLQEATQGLTAVEAAQVRLNRALEARGHAEKAAKESIGDTKAQTEAQQELTHAVEENVRAQAALDRAKAAQKRDDDREEARNAREQERALNALTKSQEKLNETKRKSDYAKSVEELGRESAATIRLKEAKDQLTAAEEAYKNAKTSGDIKAQTEANNQYEIALKESATAQREFNNAHNESSNQLPRLRYALYDASAAANQLGMALSGLSIGSMGVAINMNHQFADVIRTTETYMDNTGAATNRLRASFNDLYRSMPASWSDLTDIGTLSGQLGIASENVAEFTRLVAMFSTTTGVSVDASATAFGRLSELLNVAAYEYQNLGSAILAVGVNSVATENEIISISQNIAGIASTVGMTADEVVGLSSAFASIGTAPELTRGTVTRLFTQIINASAEGGEKLEAFARVSGMTASQFATLWGDDATAAVLRLVQGLGQLEGHGAVDALREMGITSVRDVPNLLKLSQNYELLAESIAIAGDGFEKGALLQEHYGVVAETLQSKLVILKNSFATLVAAFGEGGRVLIPFVDLLSDIVNGFARIVETPIGAFTTTAVVGLTAILGVTALFAAKIIQTVANMQAFKTSLIELSRNMGISTVATNADTAAKNANAAATTRMGIANVNTTKSVWGLTKAIGQSAAGAKVLRTALAGVGVAGGIGLAITAIVALVERMRRAKTEARDLLGTMDNLSSAIQLDTQDWKDGAAEPFRLVRVEAEKLSPEVERADQAFQSIIGTSSEASGGLRDTADATQDVTDATEKMTIALGENAARAMANAVISNEELMDKLRNNAEELESVGFTIADYIEATLSGTGTEYIEQLMKDVVALKDEYVAEFNAGGIEMADQVRRLLPLADTIELLETLGGASDTTSESINKLSFDSQVAETVMKQLGFGLDDSADAADEAGRAFDNAADRLNAFLGEAYNAEMATANIQGALFGLAGTLIENGGHLDSYSETGRANMQALDRAIQTLYQNSEEGGVDFANNLADMFSYIEGAGIDLSGEVEYLHSTLVNTFNQSYGLSLDTTAARGSIRAFIDDAIKALQARAQLERNTLSALPSAVKVGQRLAGSLGLGAIKDQVAQNIMAAGNHARASLNDINSQISALQQLRGSLSKAEEAGGKAGDVIRDRLGGSGGGGRGGGAAGGAKKARDAAKELREEIRTLTDYANDLSSVWDRAFDLRFSGDQTFDAITSSVRDIADRFEQAENRVRDLRLELRRMNADLTGLQAELSQQKYFLSIALDYGDNKRAEQIQANIADLTAEIAEKQRDVTNTNKDLKKAQEDTSRSLTGNSNSAIQNRRDLESLVKEYQNHIKALADSGMGTAELEKRTKELEKEFIKQAAQLGYNKKEVDKYSVAFKDITVAIKNVPRNVTIGANANPAITALNEFLARARNSSANVNLKASMPKNIGATGGTYSPNSISSRGPLSVSNVNSRGPIASPRINTNRINTGSAIPYFDMATGGKVDYLASGGVSGLHPGRPSGTDTVPAWLTPGEYVIRKSAVDYYGMQHLDALNSMKAPKYFAQGSTRNPVPPRRDEANGATYISGISPGAVQLIAQAVQPYLVIDNKVIAQANGSDARLATNHGRL